MKLVLAAGAALLMFLGLSSAALAQTKSALTGAELGAVLERAGLAAEVTEDARTRNPVASAQAGSIQFWVRALDCKGVPKACSTLMFFANFDLGRAPAAKDFEAVNAFNDRQVFGRAYILPQRNEVGVDYVIELEGGVAPDHIAKNIARWADVIDAFIAHFSAESPGA